MKLEPATLTPPAESQPIAESRSVISTRIGFYNVIGTAAAMPKVARCKRVLRTARRGGRVVRREQRGMYPWTLG